MKIDVQQVDLATGSDRLVELLRAHLPPAAAPGRVDWLYHRNPDGEAKSLFLLDGKTVIGAASAFPRRFFTAEGEQKGWVLGDFCVDCRYRSLGPAVTLQRALLESLKQEDAPVWYDFPSAQMLAVYRRLQMSPRCSLVRLVKPLRVDGVVASAILRFVGNLGLATRDLPFRLTSRHAGAPWSERFDEGLGDVRIADHDVHVLRTPSYLNWRYFDHPVYSHEVRLEQDHGKVSACAVFRCEATTLRIIDLFGTEATAVRSLVKQLVALARRRRMAKITVSLLDSSAWLRFFKSYGFFERESHPVVWWTMHSGRDGNTTPELAWFLMDGDRES